MYVFMYVCMYVCMHVCMYVCTRFCIIIVFGSLRVYYRISKYVLDSLSMFITELEYLY